jgi:predicted DNA-binding protein
MHTIEFDPQTELELNRLAASIGKHADELIREAVLGYLETAQDIADAEDALNRIRYGEDETIPWEAIKAEHGL